MLLLEVFNDSKYLNHVLLLLLTFHEERKMKNIMQGNLKLALVIINEAIFVTVTYLAVVPSSGIDMRPFIPPQQL